MGGLADRDVPAMQDSVFHAQAWASHRSEIAQSASLTIGLLLLAFFVWTLFASERKMTRVHDVQFRWHSIVSDRWHSIFSDALGGWAIPKSPTLKFCPGWHCAIQCAPAAWASTHSTDPSAIHARMGILACRIDSNWAKPNTVRSVFVLPLQRKI